MSTVVEAPEHTYLESIPSIFRGLPESELVTHIRAYHGYLGLRVKAITSGRLFQTGEEYVDFLLRSETYPEEMKAGVIKFLEDNEQLAYYSWQKRIARFIDERIARKEFNKLMGRIKS